LFTSLSRSAVDVLNADRHHRDRAQDICIASIASRTRTSRTMVNWVTNSVDTTRVWIVTRAETLFVNASQVLWTSFVVTTTNCACILLTNLTKLALAVFGTLQQWQLSGRLTVIKRIAFIAWRTPTMRSVEDRLTLGIQTTRTLNTARVDTFAVVTSAVE